MKKTMLLFAILVIVLLLFALSYQLFKINPPFAEINNHVFRLEVAKTEKQQEIGLAKYKSIPLNFGMLFPFGKPGFYSFWMKNMKFPIDIIYIRNNRIVTIYKNVPCPKSVNGKLPIYQPVSAADTVLEINANLSQKYGFKVNQPVEINY
ncbi:MAG: DUF192 domain-containing protein [Patescibacteria group bacterium]|nr:DUF192 domain-containing protein [Patescibacteria group bacterium]